MAIDERSRHDLFTRLEEILGHDHATILMEHLPPVGWADVATKTDLAHLETRFDARLEAMEHRLIATFRGEMIAQTRLMIYSLVAAMVAMAGVTVTAAGLG